MAEKKEMRIENIKKLSEIFKDGKIEELIKSTGKFETEIKNIKSALEEKLKGLEAERKAKEVLESQVAMPVVEEIKPENKPKEEKKPEA